MISYLLQASVCLTLFYAFYYFFLSKEKLLNLNRFYLLFTAVASLIIPILSVPITANVITSGPLLAGSGGQILTEAADTYGGGYSVNPWLLFYMAGLAIMLTKWTLDLFRLVKLIARNEKSRRGSLVYVKTDLPGVSSFFRYILVPELEVVDQPDQQLIMQHEAIHARHWHSIDVLFFGLLRACFWFNPFIYQYGRAIKLQHEFIADDAVAKKGDTQDYGQTLVQCSLSHANLPLTHSFTEHPVERRLKMIDNLNPTTMKKLRLIWSLPLMFAFILLFGVDHEAYSQTSGKKDVKTKELTGTAESVYGKVIDGKVTAAESGKALEKVTVFFRPSNSGSFTNSEGKYKVIPLKTDTLMVFRKEGYEDVTVVPFKRYSVVNANLTKKAVPKKEGND